MKVQAAYIGAIRSLKGLRMAIWANPKREFLLGIVVLGGFCIVLDLLIIFLTIPFALSGSPTSTFQKLSRFSPQHGFMDSYTNHIRYYHASVGTAVLAGVGLSIQILLVTGLSLFTLFGNPHPTQAVGESLIGFWDGGAAPAGWSCQSCGSGDFYQKFIRGGATYGTTGGATTYTHTVSWVSSSNASGGNAASGTQSLSYGHPTHRHNSITSGSTVAGSSLPVYQDLQVIRYDTDGAPATLPAGFIGMFDTTPPAGWTQISSHDNDFLYGESDATATGGSANHTHSTTMTTGNNTTSTLGDSDLGGGATIALSPHTHTGSGTTASGDHTPLYRNIILAKADSDTTVPNGLITIWDASPPSDWTVLSGSGGAFDARFLRGAASYGGTGGAATHTHSNLGISVSSASATQNSTTVPDTFVSSGTHTHTITVSFAAASDLPPYIDVIVAKYSPSITVSGNIKQTNESTAYDCSANNLTINVSVNGGANTSTTCTAADGSYSVDVPQPSTAGDPIVVSIDSSESVSATTVTLATDTSSNISGLDLYQNRLVVTHENAGPMTNAKLATGDNGNAGIRYSVAASALTVESGIELHVKSGKTYTPGGTVTTNATGGDLHIDDSATATLATAGNSIGRDILVDTGATVNLNADMTVGGGDITTAGTGIVATSGTPTITMHGTGSIGGGSGAIAFYNLTIGDATAAATTAASDFSVSNVLDVDTSDSLSIASGKTITMGSAATVTLDGSITGAGRLIYANISSTFPTSGTLSSILRFDSSSGNITVPARTYGGSVELYSNSGTDRNAIIGTSAGQTITISGDYLLIADGTASMNSYHPSYNPTMIIGGSIDFIGVESGSEHIEAGTSNWVVSGSLDTTGGNCYCTTSNFAFDGSGTINIGGDTVDDLTVSGTYTFAAGTTPGVNGALDLTGSTVDFTTTSVWLKGTAGTIIGDGQTFYNLYIGNGSDTISVLSSDFSVSNNLNTLNASDTLSIGSGRTVTLTGTLTVPGTISGVGRLTYANTASFPTTGTISSILRFDATNGNQTMSVRDYLGAVEIANTSNTNARTVLMGNGSINISGALTLFANGTQNVTLDGDTNEAFLNVTGDVDYAGTNAGTEIITTGSQGWFFGGNIDLTGGTFTVGPNHALYLSGNGKTLTSNAQPFYDLIFAGSTTLADPLDVDGNLSISSATLDAAGNDIIVGGNWSNDSTFTSGNNTVTFDAGSAGKTIDTGGTTAGKTFYNVLFNNTSGGWTVQTNNMTVANNLTLTDASALTLQSGRTLEVQGNFTNSDPSATTWTGSTLYLNGSGGMQTINAKNSGDTYATLRIGASEDVAMWDSSAGTVTMDSGGCLLSQDDAGTAGQLNIYGTCNSRANEYWSYATDFDGASLSGSERKADVRFAAGSSFTVDAGDTLAIRGQSASANRTAVTRISAGNYSLAVNGTLDAQYYDIDYTDALGLAVSSTATVTELSDGSFDNIASGASTSYITVSGITATQTFANVVFDSGTDGADANAVYNVNADGAGISWIFTAAAGNKAGEAYDREVGGAVVTWTTYITAVNDGTGTDAEYTNSTSQLSANWTVSSDTGIDHYEYAIGTTPSGTQVLGYTSTGLSTNVTKTGLTLTNGTEYFITVRAVNAGADVIDEVPSDGITVDTAAATFSNIVTSATLSSFTVTWTSSEGTTTQVRWGLTDSYGNTTTEQTDLTTSHSVTVSGLASNTAYHFQLLGTDRAGNQTTSADQSVTTSHIDSTVITNTTATVLSATSVQITWTTNHAADSKVRYGLTTAYGLEQYDASLVTSHSITLTDLTPGQTYHYEVLSVGNTSTNDADATFTTNTEDVDTEITLPTNTIINGVAAQGDTGFTTVDIRKTGTLTISGDAEPNAVITLRIRSADGSWVARVTTNATGEWSLTVALRDTTIDLGSQEVYATVTKNGQTTSEIKIAVFTVSSASYLPSPTIIAPAAGSSGINPRPTITGLARSGNTVHLYLDGKRAGSVQATTDASGTGNFAFTVPYDLTPGTHILYAVAATGASASSNSPDRLFTIELPFIGVTLLSADVVDFTPEPYIAIGGIGAGGSRVDFYLNDEFLDRIGLLRTYDVVEHFTYNLYANNLVPQTYTIYAIAYDHTGKPSRKSNVITFTKTSDVAAPLLVTSLGSAPVPYQQQAQRVELPVAIKPGPGGTYTVQSGDSLWKIAEEQLGDGGRYAEIIVLNQETYPDLLTNPSAIHIGWILRLP